MAQISRDRNSSVSGTERVCRSGKGVEGLLEQSKNHWEREEEADVCLKVRCANESGGNRGLPEKMQGCAGAAKQSGGKGFREIAEQ